MNKFRPDEIHLVMSDTRKPINLKKPVKAFMRESALDYYSQNGVPTPCSTELIIIPEDHIIDYHGLMVGEDKLIEVEINKVDTGEIRPIPAEDSPECGA